MRVAVVGAGPGGAMFAYAIARDGGNVTVFDASHPREKPCGGGVTAKALALLPAAPPGDPLPARFVRACRFESESRQRVDLTLDRPLAVAARRDLDGWILRRAKEAGAHHVTERVVEVHRHGGLRTTRGSHGGFDLIVGADGASSLVRRTFIAPTPPSRRMIAVGWFASGASEMLVRFVSEVQGYLWLFPRLDHVGVGICAPLASVPTRALLNRLQGAAALSFSDLKETCGGRYAHTIPSPSSDPASILETAGDRWALVGDAAAIADPITGEGIYYALRSATILAETLRTDGSPRRYPEHVLADFGRELLAAAAIRSRFYTPRFLQRTIDYAARSQAIREVLGDLVLGEQGYCGLKRRLLKAGPRFLWQAARSFVQPAA